MKEGYSLKIMTFVPEIQDYSHYEREVNSLDEANKLVNDLYPYDVVTMIKDLATGENVPFKISLNL